MCWSRFGAVSSAASIVTAPRDSRRVQLPSVRPSTTIGRTASSALARPSGRTMRRSRYATSVSSKVPSRNAAGGAVAGFGAGAAAALHDVPRSSCSAASRSPAAATPACASATVSPDHQAKSRSVAGPWLAK